MDPGVGDEKKALAEDSLAAGLQGGAVTLLLGAVFVLVGRHLQQERLIEARTVYTEQEVQLLGMALGQKVDAEERDRFLASYCETMRFHAHPGHALAVADTSGAFHQTHGDMSREEVMQTPQVHQLRGSGHASRHWLEDSGTAPRLVVARAYETPDSQQTGIIYYSEWVSDIFGVSRRLLLQRTGLLAR